MDIMNIIFAIAVLGVTAVVFGCILSVAAKVFEVEVDERLPLITECLAGANCGGCGYPGCGGCAEAILAGKAPVTACAPAGAEGAAKIAAIMGMEAPSGEKMVAHVICNGGEASVKNFEYVGITDCVGVGIRFLTWLRQFDVEKAIEYNNLFDAFIKDIAGQKK